jgi:dihydroorotate dehydrogenase
MTVREHYETFAGEGMKSAAEATLHYLGSSAVGRAAIHGYAFGGDGRVRDDRLATDIAGIPFENPVLVGAGWDKKGRAIRGLYELGFGGVEVGTVLPLPQAGNPKPRLWTIDRHHSIGLNRLGFNSPGEDVVDENLDAASPLPCPIGLNVGRNKIMPNELASWAHNEVIRKLGKYASYIVLGISSPNTPGLRGLQDKEPLRELIVSAREAMPGEQPLFIKIDSERTQHELHDMIEVGLESGLSGFVATNTYMGEDLKAKYGTRWAKEAGGLSGADAAYRQRATETVRFIYEEAGDKLAIIGVGGVSDAGTALEKIEAGASAIQVVTAIRPSWGKVAAATNSGLLSRMAQDGAKNIREYRGAATKRGVRS